MDDDAPRKKTGFQPANLDTLSLDDLAAYKAELLAETTRIDHEVAVKQEKKAAAEAAFKK